MPDAILSRRIRTAREGLTRALAHLEAAQAAIPSMTGDALAARMLDDIDGDLESVLARVRSAQARLGECAQ